MKVVQEPVRAGKHALRIDGTNAARRGNLDRIEFQHQPAAPGTAEGTERYFGWSVFVPKKLTDDFHSVGYFETRNSWRQLMSFEVHVLWSRDTAKGFVEVWYDGEQVVPRTMTATLLDENEAFLQIGMMRATSEVPESIIIDHVTEGTTLEDVTPPQLLRPKNQR